MDKPMLGINLAVPHSLDARIIVGILLAIMVLVTMLIYRVLHGDQV